VTCVSPTTVNVDNGSHTFVVRARDLAGNVDPEPPSFTWVVAGVAKEIPTLSEWMLLLLGLMLAGLGIRGAARQRR